MRITMSRAAIGLALAGCAGTASTRPSQRAVEPVATSARAPVAPEASSSLRRGRAALLPRAPHGSQVYAAAWSADGRFLATVDERGSLAVTDEQGRVRIHAAGVASATSLEFDSATRFVVVQGESGYAVIDLGLGEASLEGTARDDGYRDHVAFDAGGARLARVVHRRGAPTMLVIDQLHTGAREQVAIEAFEELHVDYVEGVLLLRRPGGVEVRDGTTGVVLTTAPPPVPPRTRPTDVLRAGLASPDGSRVALVVDGRFEVRDASGAVLHTLGRSSAPRPELWPLFLADGTFAQRFVLEGESTLWLVSPSGATRACGAFPNAQLLPPALGNALFAVDDDTRSTIVCTPTDGRVELPDVTVLDHDASGLLLAAAGEDGREAWLATRISDPPEGTRLTIRAPACDERRREFAGCAHLHGELASGRVLLHLDRVVAVYDRSTGDSLLRRTIPGSGILDDVELLGDGAVRIVDRLMAVPSGELTALPEDDVTDPVLGSDPFDVASPPATLPDGTTRVR